MSDFRHEYKYIIDAKEDALLSGIAHGVLSSDKHADSDGKYVIRSLYFDTVDDRCLYENINGYDPRWKYRIRYYNDDTTYISLEKKSKTRGMTKKESVRLSIEDAMMIIDGDKDKMLSHSKLTNELVSLGLIPKIIITYEREPYIYPAGNVRVTFDRNISSSTEFDKFFTGEYALRPVMECGRQIMEVKWDEVLPAYIKNSLNVSKLTWTSYSKYSMGRRYHL